MSYVKSFSARYGDEGTVYEQLTKIFPMVTGIVVIVSAQSPSPLPNQTTVKARDSLTPYSVPARSFHLHHAERAHRCRPQKRSPSSFAQDPDTLQDETRAIKAAIKANHYADEAL